MRGKSPEQGLPQLHRAARRFKSLPHRVVSGAVPITSDRHSSPPERLVTDTVVQWEAKSI